MDEFRLTQQLLRFLIAEYPRASSAAVNFIFEKVLDEPNLAELFADLCHSIATNEDNTDEPSDSSGEEVFKTLLLVRTKAYWEEKHTDFVSLANLDVSDEGAARDTSERIKNRYIANARFIAALFNHGLLTTKFIVDCFAYLVRKMATADVNERHVECLAKLLMSTGKDVMVDWAPEVSAVVESFERLSQSGKLSPELRNFMQLAIGLKENDFSPTDTDRQDEKSEEEPSQGERENLEKEPAEMVSRVALRPTEETADEKVVRQIRDLLDELTPENQLSIKAQLTDIPFDENPELLKCTVDMIFKKAITGSDQVDIYAELCHELADREFPQIVHADWTVSGPLKFRNVLLQRAQRYFEKTDKEIIEVEAAEVSDETDKNQLEEVALKKRNVKQRYFGNIKFISELFKQEMLSERIILSCYSRLLPKKADYSDLDEEKVECLVELLRSTGEAVSMYPECSQQVDLFFKSLESMIDSGKTSFRLRLLMQDALDLKNNKFIPLT